MSKTTDRVRQILSWYASDNPGVQSNLARLMMTGTLAGMLGAARYATLVAAGDGSPL